MKKVLISVPDNTKQIRVDCFSSNNRCGMFNACISCQVYSDEKFQSMVVLELKTEQEAEKFVNALEQSTTLDCGVTQGQCTFDE